MWYRIRARDMGMFLPEGKVIEFWLWADSREKLDEILERQNRRKLVQACIEFLPTRVELDLRGWNNDIFSHSS